jgi:hypothetical protein
MVVWDELRRVRRWERSTPCGVGGGDLSVSDCECDSACAWGYRSLFVEEAGSVRDRTRAVGWGSEGGSRVGNLRGFDFFRLGFGAFLSREWRREVEISATDPMCHRPAWSFQFCGRQIVICHASDFYWASTWVFQQAFWWRGRYDGLSKRYVMLRGVLGVEGDLYSWRRLIWRFGLVTQKWILDFGKGRATESKRAESEASVGSELRICDRKWRNWPWEVRTVKGRGGFWWRTVKGRGVSQQSCPPGGPRCPLGVNLRLSEPENALLFFFFFLKNNF